MSNNRGTTKSRRNAVLAFASGILLLVAVEGVARVAWWVLERDAFETRRLSGEAMLRNDRINFMKQADGIYGYALKPGFSRGGVLVNEDGFAQRDRVPVERTPGTLRIAAMGESTTQGHNVDDGNYPAYLARLLRAPGTGHVGVEMLNAGVAGWVSDQVALRAERQVAAYRPDVVLLYVGWNDFQSYDPLGGIPGRSYFDFAYGGLFVESATEYCKACGLAVAVAHAANRYARSHFAFGADRRNAESADLPDARQLYRFHLRSLDRIVAAFRKENPAVRIVISTLVGRWPAGSVDDFTAPNGRTWWMQRHELSREDAAKLLARFNAEIRDHARRHGLLLVDMAEAFARLDRRRLQWDFAHMSSEGYELMAETFYEALRQAGHASGRPSPRREQLVLKYERIDGSIGSHRRSSDAGLR
jgi:lysophospholipase L1-like esterase